MFGFSFTKYANLMVQHKSKKLILNLLANFFSFLSHQRFPKYALKLGSQKQFLVAFLVYHDLKN